MEDQALDTVKVHNPDIPGTFMIVNAVDAEHYQLFEEYQGGKKKPQESSDEKAPTGEAPGESEETSEESSEESTTEEPQVDVEQLRKRLKKATGA